MLEFAFIGRSNVGKSSLVNFLAGKNDLAKVSATPGHTKLINFFTVNKEWRLVDLPGYGFAQVARANKSKFNEAVGDYLESRSNLAGVFALIDSRHPPQKLDLEFVHWLGRCPAPFALVFTKTDKVSATRLQENIALFQAAIARQFETLPEVFICSALKRLGRAELLGVIDQALAVARQEAPGKATDG